jgi:hypothetical protein
MYQLNLEREYSFINVNHQTHDANSTMLTRVGVGATGFRRKDDFRVNVLEME